MDTRDRLLSLIQTLYAAPGGTAGWEAFLRELCAAMDGTGAHFISHDLSARRPAVALTCRPDPAVIQEYTSHWGREAPLGV
jgi:hypothetical protein